MSFDAQERSVHGGSKVELYLFETDDFRFRWAYCTDSVPHDVGLYTYVPEAISRSELRQSAGEAGSESVEIIVPWDNPVAALHVPYLPPRPVRVTIFAIQRRDSILEVVESFYGYISGFAQKGIEAHLNCSQNVDGMGQMVPWAVFQRNCIWNTYELGCNLPRADFLTQVNDLITVDGVVLTAPSIGSHGDNWFRAGMAENPANGEVRFITEQIGNQARIQYPFTNISTDTLLNFYAGDDHTPETCQNKFNNKLNYLGFDHQPLFNVFEKGTK
jgi:hypothetical protein